MHTETPAATLRYKVTRSVSLDKLRSSGNHTVTEYEMSREPYSQKSGWINHLNERIFQAMTFKKSIHSVVLPIMANIAQSLIGNWGRY